MSALDLAAFRAAPLVREPFDHLILRGFVKAQARPAIVADYPRIDGPGSFPLEGLSYGRAFAALLETLTGAEVRSAFQDKFGVNLDGRPTMLTVRGQCGTRDGNIHTDAVTKIITVLIYLNETWEGSGGCLRLLRSGTNLEDVVAEVPPADGTLVAFRRSDNSWHGHKVYIGTRRVIQLNWVTDRRTARFENLRHRASAWVKRLAGVVRRPAANAGLALRGRVYLLWPSARHALPARESPPCTSPTSLPRPM